MFPSKISTFKQQKFSYSNSNRRLNLWEGPVRSGKTVASIFRWIKFIGNSPGGDLIMTGKTNGTLYRNIIRPMNELLGDDMYYHQELDSRVIDLWDKKIYCFGANDERAEGKIRGMTVAGGYGDELTLWPESYFQMMLSRMSVAGAEFFGSTNPDNPRHWLKVNFINRKNDLDMNVFHWPIEANTAKNGGFLPDEFVENLKKEYVGLWYRRFILGEWCVAEGAIYDFFDEDINVIAETPRALWYMASVDYGTNNPTSFRLYGFNPHTKPKVWRERGYFWDSKKRGRQKTDEEYSEDMKAFLGGVKPRKIYVDPSAASFKIQLKKDGYSQVRDADNEVLDGIRVQSRMLQSGEYAIKKHHSNRDCINEYYGYVWDEKAAKRGEDKPLKEGDHSKDEERYLLFSEFGKDALNLGFLTRM